MTQRAVTQGTNEPKKVNKRKGISAWRFLWGHQVESGHGVWVRRAGNRFSRCPYPRGSKNLNEGLSNLPTGFWKSRHLHSVYRTAWPWHTRSIRRTREIVLVTGPTSKLDGKSLALEIGAIYRRPDWSKRTEVPDGTRSGMEKFWIRKETYGKLGQNIDLY